MEVWKCECVQEARYLPAGKLLLGIWLHLSTLSSPLPAIQSEHSESGGDDGGDGDITGDDVHK